MKDNRILRIALLAPHTRTVPPAGAGATQTIVAHLADGLYRRGHEVELFCPPGSRSLATVRPVLEQAYPDAVGRAVFEADHAARALAAIEAGGFDLVHDHTGYVALAMADRVAVPMVHTMHWQLGGHYTRFYAHHGHKARLVALSRAQLRCAAGRCRHADGDGDGDGDGVELPATVIPNCVALDAWRLEPHKHDYVLWLGRVTEDKGPHHAIAAAQIAGVRLILAGPVAAADQAFFDREVLPHVDGHRVHYVGEAKGARRASLFAHARALLMPIRRCEAFGVVIIEALASGTPVIAFAEGAAPEIVTDGETGYLVDDERAMAAAIRRLGAIDPGACRAAAERRYGVDPFLTAHEALYRAVVPPGR